MLRTEAACRGRSYPATRTLPMLGRASEARMRRRVVLPAPLGPSRATNSPRSTWKSTPRSTGFSPKCFTRWRVSIIQASHALQRLALKLGAALLVLVFRECAAFVLSVDFGDGLQQRFQIWRIRCGGAQVGRGRGELRFQLRSRDAPPRCLSWRTRAGATPPEPGADQGQAEGGRADDGSDR